jgi:PAS domain S-box-containing protein
MIMESKQRNMEDNAEKDNVKSSVPLSCDSGLDKKRLKDILENIPSAVMVMEKPDAVITYANKRAVDLHGLNPCGMKFFEDTAGVKIYKRDGRLCQTEELCTYKALRNGETILNVQEIMERQDGKRLIVNVSAKPLHNDNGESTGAVIIFDDVTESVKTQDALKESEERLKNAQKIAHVGSWVYYTKEDKALWSDELFRIFGLKPAQFGPTTTEYVALIYPDDRERINKSMEKLLFSGSLAAEASFDYRIIKDDGSIRTIHSERRIAELDEENKPVKIAGIEQDITERKQIEEKLESYARDLEKLVDKRTRQLKDAERLAAIGQTAGMIGHDIRNPLQAIAGELYLMQQEVDSSPDSTCKKAVQESLVSIQEQVDYINKIISDLQDYAKTLNPELVAVDLCEVIPQLLSTVKIPNNIKAVEQCDKNLPSVRLDLTFLKRILVNLVTNAIQAMPNGGKLTIKAHAKKDHVSIIVDDTGMGIPDEIKPKIFQPLMTTKAKGQGFGLAVVKRLVDALGGTITFKSKVGQGTQFKITFAKEKE